MSTQKHAVAPTSKRMAALELFADAAVAHGADLELPYDLRRCVDYRVKRQCCVVAADEGQCTVCGGRDAPLCEALSCHHTEVCVSCAPSMCRCPVCGDLVGAWTGPETPPHVLLKSLGGKVARLELSGVVTVHDLKRLYQCNHGIPVDQQRLVHRCQLINDDGATLVSLGIGSGALLHIVVRLRGD